MNPLTLNWLSDTENLAGGLTEIKSNMAPHLRTLQSGAFRPNALRPLRGAFAREMRKDICAVFRFNLMLLFTFRALLPLSQKFILFCGREAEGPSFAFLYFLYFPRNVVRYLAIDPTHRCNYPKQ